MGTFFIGILLILLGLPFIIWGWGVYKKRVLPEKIDVRIPGAQPWPHAYLPVGFMLYFLGIFIILYPLNAWIAYIISGSGIAVELILYFTNFFRAIK